MASIGVSSACRSHRKDTREIIHGGTINFVVIAMRIESTTRWYVRGKSAITSFLPICVTRENHPRPSPLFPSSE